MSITSMTYHNAKATVHLLELVEWDEAPDD